MKKTILFINIFFSLHSFAQYSVESNFNSVHIGRNQSFLGKYKWGKFSVLAGVKYNFNKESSFPDGQRNFFKNTFWAINLKERFGAELGAQFNVLERENLNLFTFYQSQLTKSHIRQEYYLAIFPYIPLVPDPQSESDFAHTLIQDYIGPIWALENNFGIGLNAYFSNSLYFSTKVGGGLLFYKNIDKTVIILGQGWEMSSTLTMGLGWRF